MNKLIIGIGLLFTYTVFAQTDLAILEGFQKKLESDYNKTNGRIHELQEELKREQELLQNITCELVVNKQALGLEITNPSQAARLCPQDFTRDI